MEAKDGSVVDFNHVMEHIRNTHPNQNEQELPVADLEAIVKETIENTLNDDHPHFRRQLEDYMESVLDRNRKIEALPVSCTAHWTYKNSCKTCDNIMSLRYNSILFLEFYFSEKLC